MKRFQRLIVLALCSFAMNAHAEDTLAKYFTHKVKKTKVLSVASAFSLLGLGVTYSLNKKNTETYIPFKKLFKAVSILQLSSRQQKQLPEGKVLKAERQIDSLYASLLNFYRDTYIKKSRMLKFLKKLNLSGKKALHPIPPYIVFPSYIIAKLDSGIYERRKARVENSFDQARKVRSN